MLTTFNESHKTPLFARSMPDLAIGFLVDIVVNSETGIFEALWINSIEGQKLLLPKDILNWSHNRILTEDINNLSNPDALPRLKKIFEREYPLLKASVFSKLTKKPLGKVKDFTFDTISPRLLSIEIGQGLFGFSKRIISQKNIEKITKDGIWILEPEATIKIEKSEIKEKVSKLRNVDLEQKIDKE